MKISFNWLKDFIDLTESPSEIATILTNLGFETTVIPVTYSFSGVVVGKVISKTAHPQADKLSLCKVHDGSCVHTVVCGAPNVQEGQVVPFARVGAKLGDLVIKKTRIRGVDSEGMICSEKELGVSEISDGIMVLSSELIPGTDFSNIYQNDYVLEIETLPNRPDILSHYGIAIELSAKLKRPLKIPELYRREIPYDSSIVKVESTFVCNRYIAVVVDDITVAESPEWMKVRLRSVGIRPINNIVDITNYCMLELGHPLHAFDYDTLPSDSLKIEVSLAKGGEKIVALDGREYLLEASDIVIFNGGRKTPLAIAGIIGGESFSVTQKTKKILLESAVFDSKSIFNTRKRLKIATESSYRFERGMFSKRSEMTAMRALKLLGGRPVVRYDSGDTTVKNKITLFYEKIKKHTGIEIQKAKVKDILQGLFFEIVREDEDFLVVEPPDFRADIAIPEDVIEEIVRIHGYDRLSSTLRVSYTSNFQRSVAYTSFVNLNLLRRILKNSGFLEVVNYGMISDYWERYFDKTKLYYVLNPVSPEMRYLRPSLFCQLWERFVSNYKEGYEEQLLFEVGSVFYDETEKLNLGLLCCGNMFGNNWRKISVDSNFYILKGFVDKLTQISCLPLEYCFTDNLRSFMNFNFAIRFIKSETNSLYRSDEKSGSSFDLGYIGAVSEDISSEFGIPKVVWWAEVNLEPLLANPSLKPRYRPYSVFPSTSRDFSFLVPKDLRWETLSSEIKKFLTIKEDIVDNIELIDLYQPDDESKGRKLPHNMKGITLRLTLRHPSKTFTAEELKNIYEQLLKELSEKLSVKLRQ